MSAPVPGSRMRTGCTVGVFDLFHIGHLNLLEKCKQNCDRLIVFVCDDEYARNNKHKSPVFNENDRVRLISSIKYVDEVILIDERLTVDKIALWKEHPFDILFSGDDWKGSERYRITESEFGKLGVEIRYFPYTEGISSTKLAQVLDGDKPQN